MSLIEARITESLVDTALAKGYEISVNDGEQTTLKRSTDRKTILNALRSTDQDYLWFSRPGHQSIGFVWLIWGNEDDLISDCTARDEIEEIIRDAQARLRGDDIIL